MMQSKPPAFCRLVRFGRIDLKISTLSTHKMGFPVGIGIDLTHEHRHLSPRGKFETSFIIKPDEQLDDELMITSVNSGAVKPVPLDFEQARPLFRTLDILLRAQAPELTGSTQPGLRARLSLMVDYVIRKLLPPALQKSPLRFVNPEVEHHFVQQVNQQIRQTVPTSITTFWEQLEAACNMPVSEEKMKSYAQWHEWDKMFVPASGKMSLLQEKTLIASIRKSLGQGLNISRSGFWEALEKESGQSFSENEMLRLAAVNHLRLLPAKPAELFGNRRKELSFVNHLQKNQARKGAPNLTLDIFRERLENAVRAAAADSGRRICRSDARAFAETHDIELKDNETHLTPKQEKAIARKYRQAHGKGPAPIGTLKAFVEAEIKALGLRASAWEIPEGNVRYLSKQTGIEIINEERKENGKTVKNRELARKYIELHGEEPVELPVVAAFFEKEMREMAVRDGTPKPPGWKLSLSTARFIALQGGIELKQRRSNLTREEEEAFVDEFGPEPRHIAIFAKAYADRLGLEKVPRGTVLSVIERYPSKLNVYTGRQGVRWNKVLAGQAAQTEHVTV